jgi:hypothetical protein
MYCDKQPLNFRENPMPGDDRQNQRDAYDDKLRDGFRIVNPAFRVITSVS